jgi:hypothetical protein
MKIVIAYIVVSQGVKTLEFASRFAATYVHYPPGHAHRLIAVCNGGPPPTSVGAVLGVLPSLEVFPRTNDPGWDVSAFIETARGPAADCDLLVALGESVYFHRPDWLARLVQVVERYPKGMYGFFSSHVVRPHLNTTGFAVWPKWLTDYPRQVRSRDERYHFEHGEFSFWRHVHAKAGPVKLVTWDGDWNPGQWRLPQNILWRGDQSNCLIWCRHNDLYNDADKARQLNWSTSIDRVVTNA